MGMYLDDASQKKIKEMLATGQAKITAEAAPIKAESYADPIEEAKLEKEFMWQVIKFARSRGWKEYHTHDSRKSAPGFPDLVLGKIIPAADPTDRFDSRLLVAELKVGKNKPTPEQQEWLDIFRAAGVPTYVWYPQDWPSIECQIRPD